MTVELHPLVEPLKWLLGKWRTPDSGTASYPTMQQSMKYGGEIEFSHVGQPNLHFTSTTWPAGADKVLHRESGFIRRQPGTNKIAWISAHNIGLTTMEEGEFSENKLSVTSHTVGRLSFVDGTETKKLSRTYELIGDELVVNIAMETNRTPLTHHLNIRYKRV